jgi:TPP-dependent pyruvate/acetoin dehydrogenase alpha subunit
MVIRNWQLDPHPITNYKIPFTKRKEMIFKTEKKESGEAPFERQELLEDYRLACESRQASLIGRREVLSGKAKFGIFGDGKEVAQLALAKMFQPGDFRSGYYRDQTLMFALGITNIQEFFAQLYAHPDLEAEPATAGRSNSRNDPAPAALLPGSRRDSPGQDSCSRTG